MCNKRNLFCYICGLFVDKKHRIELVKNKSVVEAYNRYFDRSYVRSAWYEPQYVCLKCSSTLKKWMSKKCEQGSILSVPMIWHRQHFHKPEVCYFCQTNVVGHHYKTRDRIQYANVSTVCKPVLREIDAVETESIEVKSVTSAINEICDGDGNDTPYVPLKTASSERHIITNEDFRDLVRDLGLSWRQAETLASRFKQWNATESNFQGTFGRKSIQLASFEQIFKHDDKFNNLVYCTDVDELFVCLSHEHRSEDWRLFLDGSCKSMFLISNNILF